MGKLNPKRIKNNQISVKVVDLKELDMCKKGAGMVCAKRGWYGMRKKGLVWYDSDHFLLSNTKETPTKHN